MLLYTAVIVKIFDGWYMYTVWTSVIWFLYQTFINLSSRSRIFDFFPSPCQASDLLRTAQLQRSTPYNVQCIALQALPRLSGVSARKLPFYLEKQIIWLLSWGYNERDNWNIMIVKWLLFAWFKWLPRYKAKRCPLSSAPHSFSVKI